MTRRICWVIGLFPLAALGAGCDPTCGPGDASATGLVITGPQLEQPYGGLTYGYNNDCPSDTAPSNVISMTISGGQLGGSSPLTLCVPRPDKLKTTTLTLGSDVQVIDVAATIAGCVYHAAKTPAPTGTVKTTGFCDDPTAGFALHIDGEVTLLKTCAASSAPPESVRVTLKGSAAILPL